MRRDCSTFNRQTLKLFVESSIEKNVPVAGNSIKNVTDSNKLTLALYNVNSTKTARVLSRQQAVIFKY